jgi:nucleoside-diphosphate-sugar epimerase
LKIFITGGTGFIGQHLIQLLSGYPHELFVLTRNKQPQFWCGTKKIHIIHGDLSKPETYKSALSQCSIIVNMAAEINDKKQMDITNITGTKSLVTLVKEFGIKKLIHLSSVGVVGAGISLRKRLVNEVTECFPENTYEISKLESENIFLTAGLNCDLYILRPTNVFGDQHKKKFLLTLFNYARRGKLLIASRNSKFNYVYAGDVAHIISEFIHKDLPRDIYNVGSPIKAADFFKSVRKHTRSKSKIILIPDFLFYPLQLLKIFGKTALLLKILSLANKVEFCDSSLQEILNYKFGIDEGIRRTADYYDQSGFFKN